MSGRYLRQLKALMPRGRIWEMKPGGVLYRLTAGTAEAFERVHVFFERILRESDISTATENSLDEWERDYGLPDLCSSGVNTLPSERARAVRSKMNMGAGQEIAAFRQVLEDLGYEGSVTPVVPFVCGKSMAGRDRLNGDGYCRYYLTVEFKPRKTMFVNEAGESEEKTVYGDDLICTLDRMKQAHTAIVYYIKEETA